MIKFWAWIYRNTGWYAPFAEAEEYRYLKSEMKEMETFYGELKSYTILPFGAVINIWSNAWRTKNGFVYEWKR